MNENTTHEQLGRLPLPALLAVEVGLMQYQAAIRLEIANRHVAQPVAPVEQPGALVLIRDACKRMEWSYSWANRRWSKLGGFKDVDGKLKIRADLLARHAA